MPLAIQCPHCKSPVGVSPAMIGQFVACPACRGHFPVPASAAAAGPAPGNGTAPSPPAPPPPPPPAAPPLEPPPVAGPAPPVRAAATPPAAPAMRTISANQRAASMLPPTYQPAPAQAPAPAAAAPNVARFVVLESTESVLQPGADGSLPKLALATDEGGPRKGNQQQAYGSFSPLVLASVLTMSLGMSAILLFADFDRQGTEVDSQSQARADLQLYYENATQPLKPYQIYLREAQWAHSRRDYRAEQAAYRKVLELLRTEGKSNYQGLTGTPTDDENLEHLLSLLLRGGPNQGVFAGGSGR